MSFKVLIPARYAATRLPGKPLLDVAGQPLIERVYRAAAASSAAAVIVVTDDERIAAPIKALGGKVCITASHASGTDRLAEAVQQLGEASDAVVVNLQGDEPLMPAKLISQVAGILEQRPTALMATLYAPLDSAAQIFDPNIVKLVCDARGRALYFSRAPIPWDRSAFVGDLRSAGELPLQPALWHRHIGLYAYRCGFLQQFSEWGPSPLEELEMLEQLRALWNGVEIWTECAGETPGRGVDTADDLDYVRQVFESGAGGVCESTPAVISTPAPVSLAPPEKPADYECCGRGCERCVFVYYEEAMERWRQAQADAAGTLP